MLSTNHPFNFHDRYENGKTFDYVSINTFTLIIEHLLEFTSLYKKDCAKPGDSDSDGTIPLEIPFVLLYEG